jgi:hypothetical protein
MLCSVSQLSAATRALNTERTPTSHARWYSTGLRAMVLHWLHLANYRR